MKKGLSRSWEGHSKNEYDKDVIDAYGLLTNTFHMKYVDIFNSNTVYRYMDIVIRSGDHEYKIFWDNEVDNGLERFVDLKNAIISCFDCNTIDSFQIYVRLVKNS